MKYSSTRCRPYADEGIDHKITRMGDRKDETFNQRRIGLHHLCFRTRSREDVDSIYRTALSLEAKIIRAPKEDSWAPGYYSVLFEDPDGIRIEANFVPGKGHLEGR